MKHYPIINTNSSDTNSDDLQFCKGQMFQYCMNSTLRECEFIMSTYCKFHFNKNDYLEVDAFVDSINCYKCMHPY